jgi:hypothetical protein
MGSFLVRSRDDTIEIGFLQISEKSVRFIYCEQWCGPN